MKAKHYRKEFNLADRKTWAGVMSQFKEDFMADLLEFSSYKSWSWDTLDNLIEKSKQKFEAIWLKETFKPPISLWDKFWKEMVEPTRKDAFPKEFERRQAYKRQKQQEEKDRKRQEKKWEEYSRKAALKEIWVKKLAKEFDIEVKGNWFLGLEVNFAVVNYLKASVPPVGAIMKLGLFGKPVTQETLHKAFRKKVFVDGAHPDHGGYAERFRALTDARDAVRAHLAKEHRSETIDSLIKEGKANGWFN